MSVYKVVARCPKTSRQSIKKIYESDTKFEKFGKGWAVGHQCSHNIEVYTIDENEKWILKYKLDRPKTKEEAEKYIVDNNCGDYYMKWYFEDLI
jgi:hypothetical protein